MDLGKRRLFLLFLTSMAVSVIIMIIIYGVFIKDIDFSFNTKNPDSAPVPLQQREQLAPVVEEPGPETHVATPESEKAKEVEAQKAQEGEDQAETEPLTNVVPLEPKLNRPAPDESLAPQENDMAPSGEPGDEVVPQPLSYVLLDGFTSRQSAEMTRQELINRGVSPAPSVRQVNGRLVLQFGVYSDRTNANATAEQLRARNVYVKVE